MSAVDWVCKKISLESVACENIRFSSLFAAGDVSRGGMLLKVPQNSFWLTVSKPDACTNVTTYCF